MELHNLVAILRYTILIGRKAKFRKVKEKLLKNRKLIDVIIKKAKSLGIVTEENEEAYRQKLDEKSIKELEDFLESIKGLEDEQQDGSASINQQETKTTDEGREPGE